MHHLPPPTTASKNGSEAFEILKWSYFCESCWLGDMWRAGAPDSWGEMPTCGTRRSPGTRRTPPAPPAPLVARGPPSLLSHLLTDWDAVAPTLLQESTDTELRDNLVYTAVTALALKIMNGGAGSALLRKHTPIPSSAPPPVVVIPAPDDFRLWRVCTPPGCIACVTVVLHTTTRTQQLDVVGIEGDNMYVMEVVYNNLQDPNVLRCDDVHTYTPGVFMSDGPTIFAALTAVATRGCRLLSDTTPLTDEQLKNSRLYTGMRALCHSTASFTPGIIVAWQVRYDARGRTAAGMWVNMFGAGLAGVKDTSGAAQPHLQNVFNTNKDTRYKAIPTQPLSAAKIAAMLQTALIQEEDSPKNTKRSPGAKKRARAAKIKRLHERYYIFALLLLRRAAARKQASTMCFWRHAWTMFWCVTEWREGQGQQQAWSDLVYNAACAARKKRVAVCRLQWQERLSAWRQRTTRAQDSVAVQAVVVTTVGVTQVQTLTTTIDTQTIVVVPSPMATQTEDVYVKTAATQSVGPSSQSAETQTISDIDEPRRTGEMEQRLAFLTGQTAAQQKHQAELGAVCSRLHGTNIVLEQNVMTLTSQLDFCMRETAEAHAAAASRERDFQNLLLQHGPLYVVSSPDARKYLAAVQSDVQAPTVLSSHP